MPHALWSLSQVFFWQLPVAVNVTTILNSVHCLESFETHPDQITEIMCLKNFRTLWSVEWQPYFQNHYFHHEIGNRWKTSGHCEVSGVTAIFSKSLLPSRDWKSLKNFRTFWSVWNDSHIFKLITSSRDWKSLKNCRALWSVWNDSHVFKIITSITRLEIVKSITGFGKL